MTREEQYFNWANTENFGSISGPRTGREYKVRNFTYGVLVPDLNHPLSNVSVANSSLSIDLWAGCSWQCRYCHVQDTLQDLANDYKMPTRPHPRSHFSVDEIIDELVSHPFFVRDQTIISIGTASTEPFAPGPVTDSTFEIMDAFIERGLKNPFWIVTKAGIPQGRKQELALISSSVKGLMISICWADNPDTIEPMRNNRFKNCEEAKEAGATVSWYLRPIVPEWSGTSDRIEMMMLWVSERYREVIDMIVPGGLRWTEGIEYGLSEVHGLPMPNIPHDDNIKSLPDDLWQNIETIGDRLFPGIPIYHRSSCALTNMLKVPSITSVNLHACSDCERSICPTAQRQICAKRRTLSCDIPQAQRILDCLGVPAHAIEFNVDNRLVTNPDLGSFTYAIRRSVENRISQEGEIEWTG